MHHFSKGRAFVLGLRNEKKFDNQRELSSFQLAPKKQDFDKTMEKVQELKEKGNIRFKGKDFSDALTLYSRALTALGDVEASTQEEKDKVIELKVVLICNRAACSLSLKDYDAVIKSCNQALEYDPKHEKAHYRRSKAYSGKGRYDLALMDMTIVSQIRKNDRRTAAECEALRRLVEKERATNFVGGKVQTLQKGGISEKFEAMQSLLSATSSEGDHKNGHDLLQSAEGVEVLKQMIVYKEGEEEGAPVKKDGKLEFVVVYNKKAYEFSMKSDATVLELKAELRSKTHIADSGQLLVGGEVMVEDDALLWDYGVKEGARLTLVGMGEKELKEKWGKDGEGEDELYKKHGSCSSFRSMALLVLYQVAKEKANCGDILKVFGIDMFFDVLNQAVYGTIKPGKKTPWLALPRGQRRVADEVARLTFLLLELFVVFDEKAYRQRAVAGVVKVMETEGVGGLVLQGCLRMIGRVGWREEMVPEFVDCVLKPVLHACCQRPLALPPLVNTKEKEKGKEKEGVEYYGYVNLSCQRMGSIALSAIFGCIRERKNSQKYIQQLTAACHSIVGPLLGGSTVEKNIQGLVGVITISMASSEAGKDVIVKEITAVTAGMTSFPASSPQAKHTMLLLTAEIIATASSSKDFRVGHIQYQDMEEVIGFIRDVERPDVQARGLAILAKLSVDNLSAKSLAEREGDMALDVASAILTEYNKNQKLKGSSATTGGMIQEDVRGKDKMFGDMNSIHWTMEAISYFTGIPAFKEKIVSHPTLLGQMILFVAGYDINEQFPNMAKGDWWEKAEEGGEKKKVGTGQVGTVSDFGFVGAMFNLTYDPSLALAPEERERAKQIEAIHEKAGTKEKRVHELDETPFVTKRVEILLQKNIGRALSQVGKVVAEMSDSLQEMLAGTYLHLTRINNKRGSLAAEGALKVLTYLGCHGSAKCQKWGGQALARILISVNPNIALSNGAEYNALPALFAQLNQDSALNQFEALLALTNLASMGPDVATAICTGKRLSYIESLHHENHPMIRRAATELLCNLTVCERYIGALMGDAGNTRILIITKLVFEDDEPTALAAMGILASLSAAPDIQKHLLSDGDLDCFGYGIDKERSVGMQHRAIIALVGCIENKELAIRFSKDPPLMISMLLNLERLSKGVKGFPPSCAEAAKECIKIIGEHGLKPQ